MESALRFTITAILSVALIAATLTSAIQTQNVFAEEESQVTDCLDQFNGTRTSPYVADDIVSIDAKQGTYNVSADYLSVQDDILPSGFFYELIPTNTQPASAVFEEGETISFVIRSNKAGVETVPGGSEANVARLYASDVSDCDIVFDPNPNANSIPADKKFILDSVTVTDLGDGTYLHTVVIPSKAILGDNFTKLFIEYRDETETRVYYSLPNVEIVSGPPTGTLADATNQATGQSMFAGGRTFYGEQFGPDADIINKVVDCATVELRRHDAPTGNAEIGFYDSDMNLVKQFGTIDVSTLTTGYKAYEFCLPSTDSGHQIQENQILAVVYDSGDSINRIDVRRSNIGSGPDYDGLASYHVNYDSIWHIYNTDDKSRDLLFKLTNN
jgi:hypothetical protein